MKKYLRRVIYVVLLLAVLLIIYPPLSYKKLTNNNPLDHGIVKGVYHVHSVFSDGKGDINRITLAAQKNGLDFVILTDHGRPNLKCANSTSFYNKVLLIGGSEFSLDCGHLATAGFKVEKSKFPSEPQEAMNDMIRHGGFSFIAHPFDSKIPWTDWDVKNFTGIEILSSYSCAKKMSIPKLIAFPLRYLLNYEYALLDSLEYPKKNFESFDSFNKKGKYMGIYALDAHAKIPITKKITLNFPSYKALFGSLNIYVKTGEPISSDPYLSSKLIVETIKKGRYYSVIEGIAPANGFNLIFRSSDGNEHDMGESIPAGKGSILADLPFEFPVVLKIVKNGKQFFKKRFEPSSKTEISIDGPGVYRCEVFADKGKFTKLPWITTNPFFIGIKDQPAEKEIEVPIQKPVYEQLNIFHVEKNDSSSGNLSFSESETGEKIMKLDYTLDGRPDNKNFWVSLAARKAVDLSGFTGISLKTRSGELMRYWIEVRTGEEKNESWYRHSFLSTTEWADIMIPFKKMILISGNKENKKIDIANIRSIFISINSSSVNFPLTEGSVEIMNISSYK